MARKTAVDGFAMITVAIFYAAVHFLKPGAAADIAVLELREGTFEFEDNFKNTRTGRQRLFPSATVLAGKRWVA